jgi:hypothetical protein
MAAPRTDCPFWIMVATTIAAASPDNVTLTGVSVERRTKQFGV